MKLKSGKIKVSIKNPIWYQLIIKQTANSIIIIMGLLTACGIFILEGMPLKFSIAAMLISLFFVLFFAIQDKERFLFMSIVLALPFASADFFLGQKPTFHAGGAQAIPEINIIDVLLLANLIYFFSKKENNKNFISKLPGFTSICLTAFILWSSFSIIMSDYRTLGLTSLFDIIKVSLLWCFITISIRNEKKAELFVKMLIIGLAIQSIFGIYQAKFGFPEWAQFITQGDPTYIQVMEKMSRLRVSGTIGWPTIFAHYLILLIPLSFCLFSSSKSKKQIFVYGFCTLIALGCLILNLSRQGWISILVSLSITCIALIYYMPPAIKKRLLFAAICVVIVIGLFIPIIKDRLFSQDYGSAVSRLPMIKVALNMIGGNPFLGTGLNSYSEVMHKYDPERLILGFQYPVHNVYLFICAEVGIPGTLFLIFFFISILFLLIKALKGSTERMRSIIIGLIGGIVGILTASMVSPGFKQNIQLWYVLMAFCGVSVAIPKLEGNRAILKRIRPRRAQL